MKKVIHLLVYISLIAIEGCDPVYHGKSIVKNETTYTIEVSFTLDTAELFSPPEVIHMLLTVPPDTTIVIANFKGRGNSKYFDCCTCEFDSISAQLIDSNKVLKKDISIESNWGVFNPNKNLGSKEVECEFKILPTDVQ